MKALAKDTLKLHFSFPDEPEAAVKRARDLQETYLKEWLTAGLQLRA